MRYVLRRLIAAVFCLAVTALSAIAGDADSHPIPKEQPAVFKELKQLVGTWEGKQTAGQQHEKGRTEPVRLEYSLTSGGSALVEKLFAGSEGEMYSIYYPEGDTVQMTHYCMLGNQPHLRLKSKSGSTYLFDFVSGGNMASPEEGHMHRLQVTLEGKDRLKQEWTHFVQGKPEGTAVFEFARKATARAGT